MNFVAACAHNITVEKLLGRYGLSVVWVMQGAAIPGSYWGDSEAGLVGNLLYLRTDTPLHSALHEAGHFICMDEPRRQMLHTDAGGDDPEEHAVCYLQVLLALEIDGYGRNILAEMDAWGYTFMAGSAAAWFDQDSQDERRWLVQHGLIDRQYQPTWHTRTRLQDP
jgi:hypothetical protein